jgi:parallel beta-helix repeat protein
MQFSRSTGRLAAALASAAAVGALVLAPSASADVTCGKYAATSGSDSARGTLDAPYRTAQKLAGSLSAGETGCLRGGTYAEDVSVRRGGAPGAPITLTSFPGERAAVVGRFWVTRDASNVTVSNLNLNGTRAMGTNPNNYPSPTVNAANVTFTGNDVTNDHQAICFVLGSGWGVAENTVIEGNRIHDCGVLPAKNHDHGIYVEDSRGAKILNNLIYDNADRGVQLYPNAQGTLVKGNVIDGNGVGVIFSGDGGQVSNDNTVEDNIITNSNVRNNVESWYPAGNPIGRGNVVRNNCIGGGVRDRGDGSIGDQTGFTVEPNNTIAKSPGFRARGDKDFRLEQGSRCEGIANGATGSTAERPTPTTAPPATGVTNPTGTGNPPATTNPARGTQTPDTTPATSTSGPAISVRTRRSGRGRIRMIGSVRRAGTIHSASATPTRAVIQIRWDGAWTSLKRVRVVNGRFDSRLAIPSYMRGRILTLRVVVPDVGKSASVRVRAR